MNLRKIIALAGSFLAVVITGIYMVSCSSRSMEGMVIFTRLPIDKINEIGIIPVNKEGGTLVAYNPDDPVEKEIILTPDFASACAPQISYDATHMLFLGQKNAKDPWEVWELNLIKKSSRKITDFPASCYTPVYLPGERLAFSREMPDTGTGHLKTLFTMNLDGTNLQQITFHPHADFITTILRDGRILMHSKQVYPKEGAAKYLAMRPNGTKAELFYQGSKGTVPGFQVHETKEGKIYFMEQDPGENRKQDIISIKYSRPLHTKNNCTANIPGNFYDALPLSPGKLLVSYRPSKDKPIGLFFFSADKNTLGKASLNDANYHLIEPVLVEPYNRPRNLPDELNLQYPTGLIVCQDVNVTRSSNNLNSVEATKIEILGIDKSLGLVPVKADGSFYLKVTADLPFRIQRLDDHNRVLSGPSDWIWVRPFERRGCVGCHEDHELVPENIVPLAINTWPVVIPVDTTKAAEKSETFKVSDMK